MTTQPEQTTWWDVVRSLWDLVVSFAALCVAVIILWATVDAAIRGDDIFARVGAAVLALGGGCGCAP